MKQRADRAAGAIAELRMALGENVRDDALARALYATDASIYQIVPDAVVWPTTAADVATAVRICAAHGVPITARGAGTGLTGGAVNRGVQLDCARQLNRILAVEPAAGIARVEPGVVLDELNAELARHQLYFAPDVATSSRATIGGMIANNSCGAHSIRVGRTVDHVLGVELVLSDGSVCRWGEDCGPSDNPLARQCEQVLATVAREYADEIARRYPKVLRQNAGYALDRLRLDQGRVNAETIICGSEGTLAVVTAATLKLSPLPRHKALTVVHFGDVPAALAAVPAILRHEPAAVELVDKLVLDAARASPGAARRRWFVEEEPGAILVVELWDEGEAGLRRRLADLIAELRAAGLGYAWPLLTDARQQSDVWELRKAGLGLLMSRPGDAQPITFVEDAAVPPERLPDYIRRFRELLAEEGVEQVGCNAHASVGLLHVRPMLNLKSNADVARMRRIADRASALVAEFGGTISGEHGDGIVRSEWLERMYGPEIIRALREVKRAFDPRGILNPGKIVDPLPMDRDLRYGGGFRFQEPPTVLDFTAQGGMGGLAGMCTGVGQCRQRLVGTMCPSFQATGDEQHTTRARANALRIALSDCGLLSGLDDPALDEVFDLCLSCKACKAECPTGTDVAKLKTEWLAHRHRTRGVPRRSRLVARSVTLAGWGSRLAPLSNWLMQSRVARAFLEHWYGLDRRVPPPRFARTTFRQWFDRHRAAQPVDRSLARPPVVYFVDTWVNCYTPRVGASAVKVLEALGYEVVVPPTVCCGRPLISQGLLDEARRLALRNVEILAPHAERGVPIVGTEPSCVSVLLDELPQLVRSPAARRVAAAAQTIETFVAKALADRPDALRFNVDGPSLLFHGHCHQKALTGTADALCVLQACSAGRVSEISSGCCGMAGAFGHEVEHYEVARAIGEQRLFPAVRGRGPRQIAASGFSCRQHIEHHTGVRARHPIEYVAGALRSEVSGPLGNS